MRSAVGAGYPDPGAFGEVISSKMSSRACAASVVVLLSGHRQHKTPLLLAFQEMPNVLRVIEYLSGRTDVCEYSGSARVFGGKYFR